MGVLKKHHEGTGGKVAEAGAVELFEAGNKGVGVAFLVGLGVGGVFRAAGVTAHHNAPQLCDQRQSHVA